ncbi:MAG: hypothetical protein RLY43_1871 [Bacteroidota bacterium]|jgi:hypothetical protein
MMDLSLFLTPNSGLIVFGTYLSLLFFKRQVELYFPIKENKIWKRSILPCLSVLIAILFGWLLSTNLVISLSLGFFTSLFHSSIKSFLNKSELLSLKDSVKPPEVGGKDA